MIRSSKLSKAVAAVLMAVLMAVFVFNTGGCGVYSASSGRVDQAIKMVAVEYFENRTREPDLGIDLAEAIIDALQEDNTLRVVNYEVADSVIEGAVVFYEIKSAFISDEQQVDEFQVQIAVELTFRVKESGETVFEKRRFTGVGNYYLNDTDTNEVTAKIEAGREITNDVLAEVVEDW